MTVYNVRYYKSPHESGNPHTGYIYTTSGVQVRRTASFQSTNMPMARLTRGAVLLTSSGGHDGHVL